jgi:hypothetical protein
MSKERMEGGNDEKRMAKERFKEWWSGRTTTVASLRNCAFAGSPASEPNPFYI